jgi:WD40 repeat protein
LELDPPIATVLSGHKQGIYSVTFSPDGRWLVTASDDKTARRWDATAADPPSTGIVLDGDPGATIFRHAPSTRATAGVQFYTECNPPPGAISRCCAHIRAVESASS